MAIELDKLKVVFDGLQVLDDFSLRLPEQGWVCFTGPSGCGKTTLLHVLAGLRKPQSGMIRGLEQQSVSMLFQEDRLLPWLNAAQNVALVLPSGQEKEAMPWLEMVELAAEGELLPRELSGGMRRRVALARALAYQGDLLLLDEPTNGLDSDLAGRIMGRLRELYAGRLVVTVTHDREFAALRTMLIEFSGPPLKSLGSR